MKAPQPWAILEHKFYFDELYDRLFYYPADWLARFLGWAIEGPIIGGSIRGLSTGVREAAGAVRQLQTGLVRTYAFGVAAGLAVLVLVFIAVDEQMTAPASAGSPRTLILLPLIAALVIWVVPMPRVWIGPAALAVALAEIGCSGSRRSRGSTSTRAGLQESSQATWSRTSRSRTTSGCSRGSRSGSSG